MTRTMSQISIYNYFNQVKPNLTTREAWVLGGLEELGTATAQEVADHLGAPINYVSGRFTGLKKKQRIEAAGERLTNGRKAMTYRPIKEVEHEFSDTE